MDVRRFLLDICVLVVTKYSCDVKGGDTCLPLEERQKMWIGKLKSEGDVKFWKKD